MRNGGRIEVPVRAGRGTIAIMVSSRWPLADLWLQTPDLELRWPGLDDLHALADLAAAGVHDPEVQPFMVAWTDAPPEERARGTLQYHWSRWGSWTPSDWMLELAVIRDGTVVGTQGIGAHDFAVLREVHTGSWLGRAYQGQGIGTQMRAAVLQLAFEGLGARWAVSGRSTTTRPRLVSRANSATATMASSGTLCVAAQPSRAASASIAPAGRLRERSRYRSMACRPAFPCWGCPPATDAARQQNSPRTRRSRRSVCCRSREAMDKHAGSSRARGAISAAV
jgi:RimJ/RimL family protein N-acetyltransferase